jgi:hypothetical protein
MSGCNEGHQKGQGREGGRKVIKAVFIKNVLKMKNTIL